MAHTRNRIETLTKAMVIEFLKQAFNSDVPVVVADESGKRWNIIEAKSEDGICVLQITKE